MAGRGEQGKGKVSGHTIWISHRRPERREAGTLVLEPKKRGFLPIYVLLSTQRNTCLVSEPLVSLLVERVGTRLNGNPSGKVFPTLPIPLPSCRKHL